tara:strand:+ start:438 stop:2714 length:2277 start_codon:yes stop_codon:yes gene_type:complete
MAATTVDTLLVRIEADMSGIRRDLKRLEQTTQSSTKKMQGAFAGLSRFVGPAIGVAFAGAVAAGSKAVIGLASDIEEMQAKSDVVFGAFAGEVRQQLSEFAQEVGRSAFELEGMAASVQDTFVPMGIQRGEAAKLSVQLAKLATDVASFNNAQDTDVMNAFQSALVGNHETVRRFGIVITEVELKEELLRMGINKASKDVDQATKIQARLNLIMAGTTDAQGDAARTAGSFANQTRALNASLMILGKEIGDEILPHATALVAAFNKLAIATTKFLASMNIIRLDGMQQLNVIAEKRLELAEREKVFREIAKTQLALDNMMVGIQAERLKLDQQEFAIRQKLAGILSKNILDKNKEAEATKETNDEVSKGQKFLEKYNNELALLTLQLEGHGPTSLTFMLAEAQQKLGDEFEAVRPELEKVFMSLTNGKEILDSINQSTEETSETIEEFKNELSETDQFLQDFKSSVGQAHLESMGFEGSLESVLGFLQQFPEATAKQVEEFIRLAEIQNNVAETLDEKVSPALEAALGFIDEMANDTDRLRLIELGLIEAFLTGVITLEQYEEMLKKLSEQTKEVAEVNEKTSEMMKTFQSSVESASRGISDNFADMLVSGKTNMEGLKNVFENMVKTIISKAFELMVVNRIMNSIFGGVTGFQQLPTMGMPQTASGGSISSPRMVGERGPELFIPHSAGVIKNAQDTKSMMGGQPVVVNQTLNIETGVAQTVRAEILTMMPMIQNSTLSAVRNARQRGGSFAATFGG